MKNIRKLTAVVLLITMLFCFAGCAEATDQSDPQDEAQRLNTILNQLTEESEDEGLGSALAVKYAVKLIAWGKGSSLSAEETAKIVGSWLKERSPEMRKSIKHWVNEIASAAEDVLSEDNDVRQALEDGSWKEKVKTILDSVLESGGID